MDCLQCLKPPTIRRLPNNRRNQTQTSTTAPFSLIGYFSAFIHASMIILNETGENYFIFSSIESSENNGTYYTDQNNNVVTGKLQLLTKDPIDFFWIQDDDIYGITNTAAKRTYQRGEVRKPAELKVK